MSEPTQRGVAKSAFATTLDRTEAHFWQSPASGRSSWLATSAAQGQSTTSLNCHNARSVQHGSSLPASAQLAHFHQYGTLSYPLFALYYGPPYQTYPGRHYDYAFPAGEPRPSSEVSQLGSDFIDPYKDYHPNDISLHRPQNIRPLTPPLSVPGSESKTPRRSAKSQDTPTRTQPVRQTRVARDGETPGSSSTKRGPPHLLPHTAETIYLNLLSRRRELANSTTKRRRSSLQNEIRKAETMMKRAVLVKGDSGNVLYPSFEEYRMTLSEPKFAQPVFAGELSLTPGDRSAG